jgi:hypothetical protein
VPGIRIKITIVITNSRERMNDARCLPAWLYKQIKVKYVGNGEGLGACGVAAFWLPMRP